MAQASSRTRCTRVREDAWRSRMPEVNPPQARLKPKFKNSVRTFFLTPNPGVRSWALRSGARWYR